VDNVDYGAKLAPGLVRSRVFDGDPFVLLDVGCGLGIDEIWRLFEPDLVAHGFDPQVGEISRLTARERNRKVHYHATLVGLPPDHPFQAQRQAAYSTFFEPITRSSGYAATKKITDAKRAPALRETNAWQRRQLVDRRVSLSDWVREAGLESVDFVKIDTDGADLEVLLSFEDAIERTRVLGFQVETPFTGSAHPAAHSFHNVDRLLKAHGFLLCTLSVNRYSRSALPAPFVYAFPAQTQWGQAMWGDMVFLREGVHAGFEQYGDLSPSKLLKLACLYELFEAPDVAAEILVEHRAALEEVADVGALLDLITPPLDGEDVGYEAYLAAFEADPSRFYASAGDDGRRGIVARLLNR